MISLISHDSQWGRSEVVTQILISYPHLWHSRNPRHLGGRTHPKTWLRLRCCVHFIPSETKNSHERTVQKATACSGFHCLAALLNRRCAISGVHVVLMKCKMPHCLSLPFNFRLLVQKYHTENMSLVIGQLRSADFRLVHLIRRILYYLGKLQRKHAVWRCFKGQTSLLSKNSLHRTTSNIFKRFNIW